MKTLKRMLAVMLAVVMMMGLGVTSMARETTYTVKIYLQTATRNARACLKNILSCSF